MRIYYLNRSICFEGEDREERHALRVLLKSLRTNVKGDEFEGIGEGEESGTSTGTSSVVALGASSTCSL